MYARWRHGWFAAAALVTLMSGPDAKAWVETAIQSDVVTLDIDRDGSALVRHELMMRVRGGPLQGFDLEGVDSDAAPLPDATVVEAATGAAANTPIAVLAQAEEPGTLRLEVDSEKGLRRGTYLFRVAYKTQLLERNLINLSNGRAEVRWIGPRFPDGIDSVKVVFRLPPAAVAPELPRPRSERDGVGPDEIGGVFLSNLHRAADKDELEIIRPHVAKGEPVLWRVQADARAFSAFSPPEPPPDANSSQNGRLGAEARQRGLVLGAGALIALLYAMLVWAKWRALVAACALRSAEPRALLCLPAPLRAALSGIALTSAGLLAGFAEHPTVGGVLLLTSMALATHLTPIARPAPRGPGRWLPLSDEDAFAGAHQKTPGRWLDATSLPGFLVFLGLLAGFTAGALTLLSQSPYTALLVALASGSLMPLFLTGRSSELPADPVQAPRRVFRKLVRKLRRRANLKVVAWARIPDGAAHPDELRLLVLPRPALAGLTAIEVGMEYDHAAGGTVATPCVLVRATDGSPAHRELGGHVRWTRGKKAEERVAVLRPKLPTFGLLVGLVERLSARMTRERASANTSSPARSDASRTPKKQRPAPRGVQRPWAA